MKLNKYTLHTAALFGACISSNAAIVFSENFEAFNQGDITVPASASFTIVGGFNDRSDFFAIEGPGSDPAGAGNNGADLFDATTNTFGFGFRDLDGGAGPGDPYRLDFDPIDTTGFVGQTFTFSFDLASYGGDYSGDALNVEFDLDYDGVTFSADETFSLTGTTHLGAGSVVSTDSAFTNFSYSSSGVIGGDLGMRIVAEVMHDGSDRVTFDNILVESVVPEPSAYAFLAGASALCLVLLRRRGA